MRKGFIYYIHNIKSGKIYIGSTLRGPRVRRTEHFSKLRYNKHSNKHLQSSFNKYGEQNFVYGILDECDESNIHIKESHYIQITRCYKKDIGYNKSAIAEAPNTGRTFTKAQRMHLSNTLKGRPSKKKGRPAPYSRENIKKAQEANRTKVINLCTGFIYDSIEHFKNDTGISYVTFMKHKGVNYFKGIMFDIYDESLEYQLVPEKKDWKIKRKSKRKVKNVQTGKVFDTIAEAASFYKTCRSKLGQCLKGSRDICGGYNWEEIK